MSDDGDSRRAANRAAFPGVTELVQQARDVFGDAAVTVVGAAEGERSVGEPVEWPEDSDKVFRGDRLVLRKDVLPMEVYRKHGKGVRR